ncbi:chitin deacetylase, partial [Lunasporangiospora selenospora]
MARQRSLQSKKPRSTALISAVALVLGLTTVPFTFQDITVAAAGIITHKADISHEKGSSPWPKYGEKPETNTPEIRKWVKMVDWSKVPKLPVRKAKSPGDPPECPSHIEEKDCWWTCSGCFAPDDIVECPGKNAWGLTFDDGPEPGTTENLFEVLKEKNVTATFFVTGMKSSRAPWLLQETIDQ